MPIQQVGPNRLHEVFLYDSETGSLCRRDGRKTGRVDPSIGYVRMEIDGERHLAHRIAWAMHYGVWPVAILDHKNRDKTDNRIENLREATHSQNAINTTARSGIMAVRGKWRARIGKGRSRMHLGYFDSKPEAEAAYSAAARELYGEFACR